MGLAIGNQFTSLSVVSEDPTKMVEHLNLKGCMTLDLDWGVLDSSRSSS